nr:Abi family protein [Photorhabdus luminescens]
MLKYRNDILARLGIPPENGPILQNWLSAMNVLRNRCAHHSRIWNKVNEPKLKPLPNHPFFNKLGLTDNSYERMYGMIAILWFLIKEIGPSSKWISTVADLIDNKPELPGCNLTAMGLPNNDGLPRVLFDIE